MSEILADQLKKNTIKCWEHTIKLDNEAWEEIKSFFTKHYRQHSITVTMENGSSQEFLDFDKARDQIIKEHNKVHTIQLFAQDDEEHISIDYVNGEWTKHPAMSAEAAHIKSSDTDIEEFLKKLKSSAKPKHLGLFNGVLIAIYLFFLFACYFRWMDGIIVSLIVLGAIFMTLIVGAVYSEMKWGRKRILFWLDEDKKQREISAVKKIKSVAFVSYGIMFVFLVVKIFF